MSYCQNIGTREKLKRNLLAPAVLLAEMLDLLPCTLPLMQVSSGNDSISRIGQNRAREMSGKIIQ